MEVNNAKAAGYIVVTTDKGLCGGLNTNVLRLALAVHLLFLLVLEGRLVAPGVCSTPPHSRAPRVRLCGRREQNTTPELDVSLVQHIDSRHVRSLVGLGCQHGGPPC